jgi:hypothetical protein
MGFATERSQPLPKENAGKSAKIQCAAASTSSEQTTKKTANVVSAVASTSA